MQKQKKVLFLGGTAIQMPAIRKAKEMGLYVITCDNRPSNPGHALADEYHDISIADNDAVLQLAEALQVDGVVNYILEPGIQAAAYAQEHMGKPANPYASVHTVSNKRLFRQFLADNGFNTPRMFSFREKAEGVALMHDMLAENQISLPVVVKPTDLWGSRGVTRVDDVRDFEAAADCALDNSRGADIIVEEFVEAWHAPLEGDGFAVDGMLQAHLWGDCYPDPEAPNPITPVMYCYPSEKPADVMQRLDDELQRLMTLLGMRTSAYNIEARISKDGKVYLMEVAPRNGSNATTDVTSLATGMDIMEATIRIAIGDDCHDITDAPCQGFWSSYIVHTNKEQVYRGLSFDEAFRKNNIVSYQPLVAEGDIIHPYTGTNHTVGMLVARFDTREELNAFRDNPSQYFSLVHSS